MFLESKRFDMDMFAVWLGHVRGDYYGNFSIRSSSKILQKGKGFHCRQGWFDWALNLPLDWHKIIDSEVKFSENIAPFGVDLESGEFIDNVTPVDILSGVRFKK